jgi:hypothetical protein
MKPEIRAAVKTLTAAFKIIVDALAEAEAHRPPPRTTPAAPPVPVQGKSRSPFFVDRDGTIQLYNRGYAACLSRSRAGSLTIRPWQLR